MIEGLNDGISKKMTRISSLTGCAISFVTAAIVFTIGSSAFAASRPEPVPLYGSYIRNLDRSKQTFNGRLVTTDRPIKQKEDFFTVCKAAGCVAHTPNLYAPPGSPKFIDYHWVNNRWELKADQFFHCNDGSQIKSILSEFFTPNGDGSFSGERSIKTAGSGCPGEGPGVYQLPFKLTPV